MSIDKVSHMNSMDKIKTSTVTASGTVTMVPAMGRRNYIKLRNIGSVDITLGNSDLAASGTNGFIVAASGGEWEDTTDAPVYIVSTGADSEVRIYERATR